MCEAVECQDGSLTSLTESRLIRMQVDSHGALLQGRLAGGGVGAVPHTVTQGLRLSLLLPKGSAVISGPGVPTSSSSPRREARAGALYRW